MRNDGRDDRRDRGTALTTTERAVDAGHDQRETDHHLVFDFTDVQSTSFLDLALIITARLHAPQGESVWVRGLQPRTAYILRALGLDHLFRHYPTSDSIH